jgi:FlaA1/EpsC-like NDP-sugar epimerase
MGEPLPILDLARRVIRLSGRVPGKDVPITIVGARPGEKLVEEIINTSEEVVASEHPSISLYRPAPPDPLLLRRAIRELEGLALEGAPDELSVRIKELAGVPLRPVTESEVETS